MTLTTAFEKALKEFAAVKPYVVAARSSTTFDDGKFKVPFFNRQFFVSHPDGRVSEPGKPEPPQYLQLVVLHYLLTADGTAVADQWITYRHLPGAFLFEQRFESLVVRSLAKAFGNDLPGFVRGGAALGGTPMTRSGDAGFRFLAFPAMPMGCVLYLGDEEVPASVNVFFDASSPHYLPTEDLSVVGGYLASSMIKAGKSSHSSPPSAA